MLCPDVIAVSEDLAIAYAAIKRLDAFAYSCMNTSIGKLSPDPDWLEPIRNELNLLSIAAAQWQRKKPDIWSSMLTQFTNYSTLFSSTAEESRQIGNDQNAWIELLTQLSNALAVGENLSQASAGQLTLEINNLNNVQTVFSSSVDKAWAALATEEKAMIALATQVTALQDRVNRLEDDLTSGEISSGKSYVQSSVTILYTVATAAEVTVPYLTIASLVFTVGKMAYDVIVVDQEIETAINKIVDLRTNLSEEAQAAAMTKGIIQLINHFENSLAKVGRQFPNLGTMWANEKAKVDQAINAIRAGALPKNMLALASMSVAAAGWATLSDFVLKFNQIPTQGKSVNLVTNQPTSPVSP